MPIIKRVKKIFYQHTMILLAFAGFLFGLACFIFDRWVDNNHYSYMLSWLVVISASIIYGGIIGSLVYKLNLRINIDTLTGVWNRHFFYTKLEEELSRTERTGNPTALMIVDIDNFKEINDTYGHLQGDEILKRLAIIMQKNVRKIDTVVRWGGDEFAIILSNLNKSTAHVIAERIRQAIQNENFKCQVTISLGVSISDIKTNTKNLMHDADLALYRAKKTKNRTVVVEYGKTA